MLEYPTWLHPTIIKLGFFELRWYSLMYVLGFVICFFAVPRLARERKLKISSAAYDDIWLYAILAVIIGGRLGHILFFNLTYYLHDPLQVFAVWNGGMSFHGGAVGAVIAGLLVAKKHHLAFFDLMDLFVIPASIAMAFGRLGNFANAELVGKISTVPWAMWFPTAYGYRHPTQLYEAIKNAGIFMVLFLVRKKVQTKPGALSALFLFLYGTLRFLVEFLRDNETLLFQTISPAQIYCVLMIIGAGVIVYTQRSAWKKK